MRGQTPHDLAMASKWRTAFVEPGGRKKQNVRTAHIYEHMRGYQPISNALTVPPKAIVTTIALVKASRVMMSLGLMSRRSNSEQGACVLSEGVWVSESACQRVSVYECERPLIASPA